MTESQSDETVGQGGGPGSSYYRGRIGRLFPGSRRGVILSDTGREIPFTFAHIIVRGVRRSFDDLNEGMRVGFDVGWTSTGLCVSVIYCED